MASIEVIERMTVAAVAFCGDCGKMIRRGETVVQVRDENGFLDTRCEWCGEEGN